MDCLEERLTAATIASCTCEVMTDDITYHDGMCHYRLFTEAAERIKQLKAIVVDHRKILGFAPPGCKDIYDV